MNRKRILIAIPILAIVLGLQVAAGETMVLTLDDSIRLALKQNPFYLAAKRRRTRLRRPWARPWPGSSPASTPRGRTSWIRRCSASNSRLWSPANRRRASSSISAATYQFTVNFSLPVYAGGRLVSGYKTANYNLQATRESIRQTRQETVLNVKKAFYGYLLAQIVRRRRGGGRRFGREALPQRQESL